MRSAIPDGVAKRIWVGKKMDVFRDDMHLQKFGFPDFIYWHPKISDHLMNRFTLAAVTLPTLA